MAFSPIVMPYQIIRDLCSQNGLCVEECPMGAISFSTRENGFVIDPGLCTDCGSCADICPEGAITGVDDSEAAPPVSPD